MHLNRFFGVQYPYYQENEDLNDDKNDKEDDNLDDLTDDEDIDDDKDDDDKDNDEENKDDDKEIKEPEDDELVRLNWRGLREKYEEKYPDIFKDPEFKKVKNTIYREQEFTKYFPDPKDAEDALQAQNNYEGLKELVLSGNTGQLLTNIKDVSEESLEEFATNFLPSLQKTDKELHKKISDNLVKRVLSNVINYGENHDHKETGENFVKAAKVVAKAIFGNYELGKIDEPKERDEKLEKERHTFLEEKRITLLDSVANELDTELDKIVGDVDPGKILDKRPNLKKKIIAEIKEEIREALQNDRGHGAKMDSLWARERRNGYSGTLKNSLKTTFLSRAKVLMPEIRKRVRTEYLGTVKDKDKKEKDLLSSRDKNPDPSGRQSSRRGKGIPSAKEAKEKGMTARQILDMD